MKTPAEKIGDSMQENYRRARDRSVVPEDLKTPDLAKGVRELDCLYGISHLREREDASLEEMFQKAVELLPPSWRYSEVACARISLRERKWETENFQETTWRQHADIFVHGELSGAVDVYYLEERPDMDEGPFLREERDLLYAVAERMGRIVEHFEARESLAWESRANAGMADLSRSLLSLTSIEEISDKVLEHAKSLTGSRHGYVGYMDPETDCLVCPTLTRDVWDECKVPDKNIVFKKIGGLREWVLKNQKALLSNAPSEDPRSTATPEGHIRINRLVSAPALAGGTLVGQIALANSDRDYTERDLALVERLADIYAIAVQSMRAGQALKKAHDDLERKVQERTRELLYTNRKLGKEIKDHKRTEEALRKNEASLMEAQRIAHLGNWDWNIEKDELFGSDEISRIFGLTSQKFEGTYQDFLNVVHTDDRMFVAGAVERSLYEKKPYEVEHRIVLPDGSERVVQGRGEVTYNKHGGPVRMMGTLHDVTDRKVIEERLVQSEKLTSLGLLVSGIAHEINNPNNFISFNIPILRDYLKELLPIVDDYAAGHEEFEPFGMPYDEFREDIHRLLDNMEHGSQRISLTISNVKDFSRKKDKMQRKWVDVVEVLKKAISICKGEIKRRVRSFELAVDESLPQVMIDPEAMEQVVVNLLINAAAAADKEDSWLRLGVRAGEGSQDELVIEVSDNGCGMDERVVRQIFDPFFTTKGPKEGTGLGLYICHELVAGLGGRIEVESKPGLGSSFRVLVPSKARGEKEFG
jgi:PAS domain S-box-containing protein